MREKPQSLAHVINSTIYFSVILVLAFFLKRKLVRLFSLIKYRIDLLNNIKKIEKEQLRINYNANTINN